MPAYHSVFLDEPNQQSIGNLSLLPLRTRTRGPAQQLPPLSGDVDELSIEANHESYDVLDETIALFRANTFFRNFEIKGPADRTLIYGILYVSEALSKIKPGMNRRDAEKVSTDAGTPSIKFADLRDKTDSSTKHGGQGADYSQAVMNTALDTSFSIPGDATFPLNQAFEPPRDRNEAEILRQYLSQMRQELSVRLLNRVYGAEAVPSKFWLSFQKRKFMGKAL